MNDMGEKIMIKNKKIFGVLLEFDTPDANGNIYHSTVKDAIEFENKLQESLHNFKCETSHEGDVKESNTLLKLRNWCFSCKVIIWRSKRVLSKAWFFILGVVLFDKDYQYRYSDIDSTRYASICDQPRKADFYDYKDCEIFRGIPFICRHCGHRFRNGEYFRNMICKKCDKI